LRIEQLDDTYSSQRKKLWPSAFKSSLIFIGVLWGLFFIDLILPIRLNSYGIHPRQFEFLPGIISSVFLHGDLSHLISNTLPLLLAMTALFGNYPSVAKKVLIYSMILTGLLVWSFARPANHIGARGLINGLFVFIFLIGFFRRGIRSIGISFVIALFLWLLIVWNYS